MNDKAKKVRVGNSKHAAKLTIIILVILLAAGAGSYFYLHVGKADEGTAETDTYQQPATEKGIRDGEILSRQYCRSCHLLPDPLSLNKNKWQNILPQMGIRLGVKSHYGVSYEGAIKSSELIVPEKPLLSDEQWQHIIDYYIGKAPVFLPGQVRTVPIKRSMPFFSVTTPGKPFFGKQVLATYVKVDTSVKPVRIFISDGQSHQLFLLDNQLKPIGSVHTAGPVVDMAFTKNEILVCMIGKDLGANDEKAGTVARLTISRSGKMSIAAVPLFKDLMRPVQIIPADLNGDQQTDYLIGEFGNLTGALSWMENKGNGSFAKHIISNLPGAVKAYINYPAKGRLPNIWVLFTQGQERISNLINEGNGVFREMPVLRFPPIYGSSFFEMVDVNGDGFKDIIYTCGDNGNATLVLKPYHGVYVYINNGHNKFEKRFFYPINGCYKALARDFDGDGNMDIATVSLYTDARQTQEGFVYLKGEGNYNFKPFSLPPDTRFERAITLADGDVNRDGKTDLLIGNAFFDFGPFGYNIQEPLFYFFKE